MTKEDFVDWKRHPVTQEVFSQLFQRCGQLGEYLIDLGGKDPMQSAEYSGAIKAYRDMINIEYDEETHGN